MQMTGESCDHCGGNIVVDVYETEPGKRPPKKCLQCARDPERHSVGNQLQMLVSHRKTAGVRL